MTSAALEAALAPRSRVRRIARNVRIVSVLAVLLCACAAAVALFSALTLLRAKETARQWIVKPFSKALLFLLGVRVRDLRPPPPEGPVITISNHLSMLDIFVVCSLGIPCTRYFLSVSTLRVWPMAIVGRCTGVFYIEEQTDPEARIASFQRAERVLRETKESVYLSPEGSRNPGLELQKFNRGAFHMAANLHLPIVSLLIETPKESHPGLGLFFQPGTVTVRQIAVTDTSGWSPENVAAYRDEVRSRYVEAMAAHG
jgi:1-acyl-sn-glycerol-3-phosphate acyltransferase